MVRDEEDSFGAGWGAPDFGNRFPWVARGNSKSIPLYCAMVHIEVEIEMEQ